MSLAVYTSSLRIFGGGDMSDYSPLLTVRPEIEAWSTTGIVASTRKTIDVDPETTAFSTTLVPSAELTGTDGRWPVPYILELVLFEETFDGSNRLVQHNSWVFTALPGGGELEDMANIPPTTVYYGPPWPSKPTPGLFLDITNGDLSSYAIGES